MTSYAAAACMIDSAYNWIVDYEEKADAMVEFLQNGFRILALEKGVEFRRIRAQELTPGAPDSYEVILERVDPLIGRCCSAEIIRGVWVMEREDWWTFAEQILEHMDAKLKYFIDPEGARPDVQC